MTEFDAKTAKMTDTTSLRREALIEGGSSRERARLTVWSEDNPRDQLALVAICAWLNVKPDQLPSAWHGHTCEATKEAWARVAEAIKSELEADLARVTAERDAERAVADELASTAAPFVSPVQNGDFARQIRQHDVLCATLATYAKHREGRG